MGSDALSGDFFAFGSKLLSSTVQVGPMGLKSRLSAGPDNRGKHEANRLILGDYGGISFPVVFTQQSGNKLQDMLDTGWPGLYLVSDHMKSILQDAGLTGWKTFAVEIKDKAAQPIKGYNGFSITGSSGAIDYRKSEVVTKQLVANGPEVRFYKGIHIDMGPWTESDFFIPAGGFWIIASKRAGEAIKRSGLTNIRLDRLSTIEVGVSSVK